MPRKVKRSVSNVVLITGVYVSTVIGAGFSSGRELVEFFVSRGEKGIYGLITAAALFSFVGIIILNAIYDYGIGSSDELTKVIFPSKYSGVFDFIVLIAMISIYIVMISGGGAIISQQFGISRIWGSLAITGLCIFIFLNGVNGLVGSMNFMAPIIILGTFIVCIYSLNGYIATNSFDNAKIMVVYPLIYVGYNIITLVGVMPSLRKYIVSKNVAVKSAVLSSTILGILAVLISSCIMFFGAQAKEVPMLYVASCTGNRAFNILYFVILFMAMCTTSISNGYGTINILKSKLKIKDDSKEVIIFCTISFIIALMPFSILVKYLYSFLGYIGIVELFFILVFPLKAFK